MLAGLYNAWKTYHQSAGTKQRLIFNLYLFHHLIICIVRCIVVFLIAFFLVVYDRCLSLEFLVHFLLLLSTFDIILILVGETAHFWDSTINHKSTLYSRCFLTFGVGFTYFVSSLFLSIHITMGGDNPLVITLCKTMTRKVSLYQHIDTEKSAIPTLILYVLFILLDLLAFAWLYISYKDIAKLKRKRLATIFFYSLLFTRDKEDERAKMVLRSLQRLRSAGLFILSNTVVILPVLTVKALDLKLNSYFQNILIFFSILPWCESLAFIFFNELKYVYTRAAPRVTKDDHLQQVIGTRLSAYREKQLDVPIDDEKQCEQPQ